MVGNLFAVVFQHLWITLTLPHLHHRAFAEEKACNANRIGQGATTIVAKVKDKTCHLFLFEVLEGRPDIIS